jgi:hypothetical protein
MGAATAIPIFMEDSELARLAAVILYDVKQENLIPSIIEIPPIASYYNRPLEWFAQEVQGIDFIKSPIAEIDACATELLNLSISNVPEDSNFSVILSNKQSSYTWKLPRKEEQALANNGYEEE